MTSNSGFPLDQNLYQAVKGMSAAAKIVKPGGTIVCAAECRDGFPGHGSYRELLGSRAIAGASCSRRSRPSDRARSPTSGRSRSRRTSRRARTVASTPTTSPTTELREAHLEQTHDIAATVRDALDRAGAASTVCVLPEGPQTIPILASESL